ncbi:MAG: TolC family protein [Bacteriovoracaceae bacterium]|nr:TolC family protein [Bacteriovoracaceae bacterium]
MKGFTFFTFSMICSFVVKAECNFNTPNELFEMIKKNHPNISINKTKSDVLKKSIDFADQVPNPELDAQSTIEDGTIGKTYSTSLTLKHTFELGGKRKSRVKLARTHFKAGKAAAMFQDEDTIIDSILKLHRLRQIYEVIPLYEESLTTFNKILITLKKRNSISPQQRVERETLELAKYDYQLKMSKLNSEKIKLSKHLSFFAGTNCDIPKRALPTKINLTEVFNSKKLKSYSKIDFAKASLEVAQANLNLESSRSYPNLKIGPTLEYEKLNSRNSKTIGIALSFDLPVLNFNSAGKAKAAKEVIVASTQLNSIEKESILDLDSWIITYQRYRDSLVSIATKKELEMKHKRIESLFSRGIISTSLVIESHRQLIEFSNTRFEFEIGAIEALWNIYKMNGQTNNKNI